MVYWHIIVSFWHVEFSNVSLASSINIRVGSRFFPQCRVYQFSEDWVAGTSFSILLGGVFKPDILSKFFDPSELLSARHVWLCLPLVTKSAVLKGNISGVVEEVV